ncbi:hypothetical protein IWW50_006374, partial [Coemansia erecta]
MGDDSGQQHKTMIKQLTDLDDHELDEQAGLFMHPRRKSLRTETTPRPLSQPFFQPLQVFPDVLSVSAMVERQGQREQRDEAAAGSGAVQGQSSGTATPASALAQYPQGLALHAAHTDTSDTRAPQALRSVSLTRIGNEPQDAGDPHRAKRHGLMTTSPLDEALTPHGLRSGTPLETPTEEGDRQLSVEASRPSKAGRRAGKRAGAGSAEGRAQARGGRLF